MSSLDFKWNVVYANSIFRQIMPASRFEQLSLQTVEFEATRLRLSRIPQQVVQCASRVRCNDAVAVAGTFLEGKYSNIEGSFGPYTCLSTTGTSVLKTKRPHRAHRNEHGSSSAT